jgi:hypothetical protein
VKVFASSLAIGDECLGEAESVAMLPLKVERSVEKALLETAERGFALPSAVENDFLVHEGCWIERREY